jgi:CPA2 family monovalent cation:H+ antiporter-2
VREDHYDAWIDTSREVRSLQQLLRAAKSVEISWLELDPASPLAGLALAQSDIRARSGASVVALLRDGKLMANPKSAVQLLAGDRVGVIGDPAQIEAARRMIENAAR